MKHPFFVSTLLVGLSWGSAATAQPSATEKETARAAFKEGDRAFEAKDYTTALRHYQAADQIMVVPPTRFAVCESFEQLGRLVEARDACLGAAMMAPAAGEPATFATTRDKAKALADALKERIPSVRLSVVNAPVDAKLEVQVDGRPMPSVIRGVPLKLDPGAHQLTIRVPGFVTKTEQVDLDEGEHMALDVELVKAASGDPQPLPPAPMDGSIHDADEGAGGGISPVTWVGFGLGAAGLLAGAVTGGLALSRSSELTDRCQPVEGGCDVNATRDAGSFDDDVSSATTLAHVSTAGFVLAGVGTALGLVGLFALSGDGSAETAQLQIGPTSLQLVARF